MREPALTDDMRNRVALRHLDARDRARGNARAHAENASRFHDGAARLWSGYWRAKADEHEAEAFAILPPADGYDWPAPAFVGGARWAP